MYFGFVQRVLDDERLFDFYVQVNLSPVEGNHQIRKLNHSTYEEDPSCPPVTVEVNHFPEGVLKDEGDRVMLPQIPSFCFPDANTFPKRRLAKSVTTLSQRLTK